MTTLVAQIQQVLLAPDPKPRAVALSALLAAGAAAIGLAIGIAGPVVALAAALALAGGILVLGDTRWGFAALAGVAFILPFASLPFSIGFKPTLLDAALGGLILAWVIRLAVGQERRFLFSVLGAPVALFLLLMVFSFAFGLAHSAANAFLVRRFAELLFGVGLYFVAVNTIRSTAEVVWVARWLMLAGWAASTIAVAFYVIPEAWTVAVLDRLVRFDYPGGYGALRYIEDDPLGTMRAIGTAVDPNVLGGMMVLAAALVAPQVVARQTVIPRWLAALMLGTALLALYLTYSRSALLGFGAALALLAVLKYRRLVWIGVAGAALLVLLPQAQGYMARFAQGIAGEDLATQMRFGEYKDAVILVSRYPLFGVGFTGVPDIDLYLGVSMLYLILAENMGLVGLAAFAAVMVGFFVLAVRAWRRRVEARLEAVLLGLAGGVTGALVSGVFDHYWFNMSYPHMTVLLWLYVGLGVATVQVIDRESGAAEAVPAAARAGAHDGTVR
jgi:hypothetical protein